MPGRVNGLSCHWISLQLAVPPVVGVLLAYPFWRKSQPIFGNIVGTAVIFTSAFGLIFREYAEIDLMVQACLDAGRTCFPEPSAFARFAIYAFIALLEVFGVFYLSLRVEERDRRRQYAPEWQR